MKKTLTRKNHGFTIIEVMIVLAIAGLILAIVFIAVPQLQRNSRDNQRQNMTARLKAELESYAANHSGSYPFTGVTGAAFVTCQSLTGTLNCNDWYSNYLTNGNVNILDPGSGSTTNVYIGQISGASSPYTAPTGSPNVGTASGNTFIIVGGRCTNGSLDLTRSAPPTTVATAKTYAIITNLDRAGTSYCLDNG